MPRYVISTLREFDVHQISDTMRRAGANIIGKVTPLNYKNSSGRFMLECPEELASQLKKIEGVKYFEEEAHYYPQSR